DERVVIETYEVRRGDTLWGIARQFGVSVEALKEANKLGNARIMAGQTLNVAAAMPDPEPSRAAEAAVAVLALGSADEAELASGHAPEEVVELPASIEYRVRRGDTLWDIARKHGVTVEELKSANGL